MSLFRDLLILQSQNVNVELPYYQLDYLQSDGSNPIDLSYIIANANYTKEYKIVSSGTDSSIFSGSYNSSNNGQTSILLYYKGANHIQIGSSDVKVGTVDTINPTIWNIQCSGKNYTVNKNGTQIVNNTFTGSSLSGISDYIFGFHYNGSYNGAYKCYYYKLWEGTSLVLDIIPVIMKDTLKIGLYDKVRQLFIEAPSTYSRGKILGLIDSDTQLNYLSNPNSCYVDTGVTLTNRNISKICRWSTSTPSTSGGALSGSVANANETIIFSDFIGNNYYSGSSHYQYYCYVARGTIGSRTASINTGIKYTTNMTTTSSSSFTMTVNGSTIDSSSYTIGASNDVLTGYSEYLLACNKMGVATYIANTASIYEYKLIQNSILMAFYIPVIRASDNTVCFYDVVSKTYKLPIGGVFTSGSAL